MGVNSNGTIMMDQGVFENLGSVTWDTTAKTTGFTAVSGNGYFVNTTSGAITVTLPSSPSAGDVVGIKDYANTADTNAITIGRNGSNIDGVANDFTITTEGLSALLVYVDATKGWLITNSSQASDITENVLYVAATGGTITTSGDYKIHTFTGPGTFTVTCSGNPAGSSTVDYMVIAGGGGGSGGNVAGGGAAGGYRESKAAGAPWSASPLATPSSLPVSVTGYPVTVGGGGSGGTGPISTAVGGNGSNSVFSSITSTGGGGGGSHCGPNGIGRPGGSGGGNSYQKNSPPVGNGNTPPVSPPQGNPGGTGLDGGNYGGGGGGGAGGSGQPGCAGNGGGNGGPGTTSSINASPVTRAGGGGGASENPGEPGIGQAGGGNGGVPNSRPGKPATIANVGSGGGGAACAPGGNASAGIVIIRYKYQ